MASPFDQNNDSTSRGLQVPGATFENDDGEIIIWLQIDCEICASMF